MRYLVLFVFIFSCAMSIQMSVVANMIHDSIYT
jgi:hypothetical protein